MLENLARIEGREEGENMLILALALVVGLVVADVTDLMRIRPRRALP